MDDFEKVSSGKKGDDYVELPIHAKDIVSIVYGKMAMLTDGAKQKDFTSEEGGLPEGWRFDDIGVDHEEYTVADIYNGLRGSGLTKDQSHSFIGLNLRLLEITLEAHAIKELLDGGDVMATSSVTVSPTARLGLKSSYNVDIINQAEDRAANILKELLDRFGLNATQLNPEWIKYKYAYYIPVKGVDSWANMEY